MPNVISVALRVVFVVVGLVGSAVAQAAPDGDRALSRLVTPETLSFVITQADDVQIVDIRSKKYAGKGTIPGARWVPYKSMRGPKSRPGQPPTPEALAQILGQAGLSIEKPIVLVGHSGSSIQMGRAAYVYWLLKTAGAARLLILDGGYKAWAKANLEIVETHIDPTPVSLELTYDYAWWADPMDIYGVVANQKSGVVLDARLDAQVRKSVKTGKPIMSIPMAEYVPANLITRLISLRGAERPDSDELKQELIARGVTLGQDMVISVCQNGELSALSWFYASEIAGIDNVKYYPDALQGWKADGGVTFGLALDAYVGEG